MFNISEAFRLRNSLRAAHEDGYSLFAHAILRDAFTWVKLKVNDIFDCLLFKEDCVDLCAMVVAPFFHVLLKLASVNFDLFYL